VQRMRSAESRKGGSSAGGDGSDVGRTPSEIVGLLRDAAGWRKAVWIDYVNAEGFSQRRLVEPVALSGGSVAAFDRLSNGLRTFVLHRITDVTPGDLEDS
jgi:predicted DNA-binding transcriptional regulator YafY